jgi:hypothetical protein
MWRLSLSVLSLWENPEMQFFNVAVVRLAPTMNCQRAVLQRSCHATSTYYELSTCSASCRTSVVVSYKLRHEHVSFSFHSMKLFQLIQCRPNNKAQWLALCFMYSSFWFNIHVIFLYCTGSVYLVLPCWLALRLMECIIMNTPTSSLMSDVSCTFSYCLLKMW